MSAATEQAAAAAALVPKLTDEFLNTPALAVIACGREGVDRAETIRFARWCYETAGREPPDFGRFSEELTGAIRG